MLFLHLLTIEHLQHKRKSSDGSETVPAAAPAITGRVVIIVAVFDAVMVAAGDEAGTAARFETWRWFVSMFIWKRVLY